MTISNNMDIFQKARRHTCWQTVNYYVKKTIRKPQDLNLAKGKLYLFTL